MNNLQICMYIHFQNLLNFHLEDVIKPLDEQMNLYQMSENSSIYNLNDEVFAKCLILMFLLYSFVLFYLLHVYPGDEIIPPEKLIFLQGIDFIFLTII